MLILTFCLFVGPYTVFVPTDRAFRALLVQLGGPDKAEEKFQENPRLLSGVSQSYLDASLQQPFCLVIPFLQLFLKYIESCHSFTFTYLDKAEKFQWVGESKLPCRNLDASLPQPFYFVIALLRPCLEHNRNRPWWYFKHV